MIRIQHVLPVLLLMSVAAAGNPVVRGGSCSPKAPDVSGPASIRPGQSYTLSWNDVMPERDPNTEFYWVERSPKPDFSEPVEKFRTSRSAIQLPPVPAGVTAVYHRVNLAPVCPNLPSAPAFSRVLDVRVTNDCPVPEAVQQVAVSPANPLAFTTYVLSWDSPYCGALSSCAYGKRYRIRRVAPTGTRDWVIYASATSLSDPPGDYSYQVRLEDTCGAAGPWSAPVPVKVQGVPVSAAIVSEPRPILSIAPNGRNQTTFAIRNTGTESLPVTATADGGPFLVEPSAQSIPRGETRSFTVTLSAPSIPDRPWHGRVILRSGSAAMEVPVSGMVARDEAPPVEWGGDAVIFDGATHATERTLVNRSDVPAVIAASVKGAFITVESTDGAPWDRPMNPGEVRVLRISANRSLRRASIGTEAGAIEVYTAGQSTPNSIRVIDDGPSVSLASSAVRPEPPSKGTRILFASTANAIDVSGTGRYTTEVWISNSDALNEALVTLFFTPLGKASAGSEAPPRRADITLMPGETRRFRNVLGQVAGLEGAAALEISSPSPSVSATSVVTSTPVVYEAANRKRRLDESANALPGGFPQYGFEMRPIAPGEGVKEGSASFFLSGLRHDARRRTNILLTETSGYQTTVLLKLFDSRGRQIYAGSEPVSTTVTVPALSTVQINDADLFGSAAQGGAPYAEVSFQTSERDKFGVMAGAVMPIATVIDQGTQDASLRIGVAATALDPLPPPANSPAVSRMPSVNGLPFGGGAAPLLFPVVHAIGAALTTGEKPLWRTRVTVTNVNENQERRFRLKFRDQNQVEYRSPVVVLPATASTVFEDILEELFPDEILPETAVFGPITIEPVKASDGVSWTETWADVDVQTETYTPDPVNPGLGDFKTGMEAYSYRHGYSSFQSNLGTVQIEGAENSSGNRTNLVLQEIGDSLCDVAISAYRPGSLVPIATVSRKIPPFGYISGELFRGFLGLDLSELSDVRVVVRQIDGDGVFMAFASKINMQTGDPANVFLRPATAGTGR